MKKCIAFALIISALILTVTFSPKTTPTSIEATVHQGKYSVTVTGTGSVKVQPDFALISLTVETRAKDVIDAQRENSKVVQNLIRKLKEQNIAENDITTSWFNIYPEYHYYYENNQPGYIVSNQLSVKVQNINNVGSIIDASTSAGAKIISGVQFGIQNDTPHYNTALIKAVESAKEKALVMSVATNTGDIKVVSVKEISMNYGGFERYTCTTLCSDKIINTQIIHSEIEITATVEVVFNVICYG